MDPDIGLRHDPFVDLSPRCDLHFQMNQCIERFSHGTDDTEPNMGIYYMRSTPATRLFLDKLLSKTGIDQELVRDWWAHEKKYPWSEEDRTWDRQHRIFLSDPYKNKSDLHPQDPAETFTQCFFDCLDFPTGALKGQMDQFLKRDTFKLYHAGRLA